MPGPSPLSSRNTSTSALVPDRESVAADDDGTPLGRGRSIQFAADARQAAPAAAGSRQGRSGPRRIPSPPPPSVYNRGVSFDTFDNRDATDFSLTLNYKHKDYQCTRRSRTFLCGIDQNDYSDFALEWLIDELVDDGDEIICLRVVEKDSKIASEASVEERRYRMEAEKLLESAIAKNTTDEKAISLIMELAVGKVQDIIQRMIQIYEPAVLIVGTRGRSLGGMQGLLPGSVSKYCLQQSPIPVIVVRPSPKREKKKKKRQADPSRKSYNHILRMSEARGSKLFDKPKSANSSTTMLHEDEAEAVAKAIGLPSSSQNDLPLRPRSKDSSSGRGTSDNEDGPSWRTSGSSTTFNRTSSTSDFSSIAVKSPSLQGVDSPAVTDGESEDDNDPIIQHGDEDGPLDISKAQAPSSEDGTNLPTILVDNHLEAQGDGKTAASSETVDERRHST